MSKIIIGYGWREEHTPI